MYLVNYVTSLHYLPVLISAIIFWLLGMLWFGPFFGKPWRVELGKVGIKMEPPPPGIMTLKAILTFLMNLLTVIGVGFFVHVMGISTALGAAKLGLLLGLAFSLAALMVTYTWQNKSLKLLLIDSLYQVVGIIIISIILTVWK
jgi:hypothetical protein